MSASTRPTTRTASSRTHAFGEAKLSTKMAMSLSLSAPRGKYATRMAVAPGVTRADLRTALDHPLFGALAFPRDLAERVFAQAERGEATLAHIASSLQINPATAVRVAALLMKIGLAGRQPG